MCWKIRRPTICAMQGKPMDNTTACNPGEDMNKRIMDRMHPLDVLIGAFVLIDILIITGFVRVLLQLN